MAVKSYTDLKEKTLAMTGFFETSRGYPDCYGMYSGNHDLQGGSWGVLQFNWGTGSIQPLLKFMFENHNAVTTSVLGANYDTLYNVTYNMTTPQQIAWSDGISVGADKRTVAEPWNTLFMNLGRTPECIAQQITYSENWRPNALRWFDTLGLWSRRGYALCWDISVQMGRLMPLNLLYDDFKKYDPTGKAKNTIEEDKLWMILNRAVYFNRDMSAGTKQIVYDRKVMVVSGSGDYYVSPFTMPQYDLNYEPAFDYNDQKGLYLGG